MTAKIQQLGYDPIQKSGHVFLNSDASNGAITTTFAITIDASKTETETYAILKATAKQLLLDAAASL